MAMRVETGGERVEHGRTPRTGGRAHACPRAHGYVLYAVGISVWMTLVACGGTTYMLPFLTSQAQAAIYVVAQQVAYVATFFVAATMAWRVPPRSAHVLDALDTAAFALLELFLVPVVAGRSGAVLLTLLGVAMGIGTTLGYLQWMRIVSRRSENEILELLFIASAVSVVTSALFYFVPAQVRLVLYGVCLVPAALVLQWLNARSLANYPSHPRMVDRDVLERRGLLRSLVTPAVCAVVLVLVAPLASNLFVNTQGQDFFRTMLAQVANIVALVVLAGVFFGWRRSVRIRDAYAVLLPILATAVLVAAFLPPEQRWFVVFIGDACFCVVSLLLLLTSCKLSRSADVSTVVVYGILGGCVYLARLPEMLLVVLPHAVTQGAPSIATAVLIYLLTLPAFLTPLLQGKPPFGLPACSPEQPMIPTLSEAQAVQAGFASLAQTCERLASEHGLSERQGQVLAELAKGQSVERTAENLGLSSNTVKTYRRAIYAALEVHSRQELLDLVQASALGADMPADASAYARR